MYLFVTPISEHFRYEKILTLPGNRE